MLSNLLQKTFFDFENKSTSTRNVYTCTHKKPIHCKHQYIYLAKRIFRLISSCIKTWSELTQTLLPDYYHMNQSCMSHYDKRHERKNENCAGQWLRIRCRWKVYNIPEIVYRLSSIVKSLTFFPPYRFQNLNDTINAASLLFLGTRGVFKNLCYSGMVEKNVLLSFIKHYFFFYYVRVYHKLYSMSIFGHTS